MSSKTSTLNVRINSELKQKVAEEAKSLGMTITEYIEYLLNRNDVDSESVLSESFAKKLKSIFENSSTLLEIKELSSKNLQRSKELLSAYQTSTKDEPISTTEVDNDEKTIIDDDDINDKLDELLAAMSGKEIRYKQDGEIVVELVLTKKDVLSVIINNYYSVITQKQ